MTTTKILKKILWIVNLHCITVNSYIISIIILWRKKPWDFIIYPNLWNIRYIFIVTTFLFSLPMTLSLFFRLEEQTIKSTLNRKFYYNNFHPFAFEFIGKAILNIHFFSFFLSFQVCKRSVQWYLDAELDCWWCLLWHSEWIHASHFTKEKNIQNEHWTTLSVLNQVFYTVLMLFKCKYHRVVNQFEEIFVSHMKFLSRVCTHTHTHKLWKTSLSLNLYGFGFGYYFYCIKAIIKYARKRSLRNVNGRHFQMI